MDYLYNIFKFIIFLSEKIGTLYLIFGGIFPTLQGNLGKSDINIIKQDVNKIISSAGFTEIISNKIFTDAMAEIKTVIKFKNDDDGGVKTLIVISIYWVIVSIISYIFPICFIYSDLLLILICTCILIYFSIMLCKIIKDISNLDKNEKKAMSILKKYINKHFDDIGIHFF